MQPHVTNQPPVAPNRPLPDLSRGSRETGKSSGGKRDSEEVTCERICRDSP